LTHTTLNWLAATLFALVLASSHLLDGPTDHAHEWAQSQDLIAAQKAASAQARFDAAAKAICGNADWAEQADGSVRCVPRKGKGQGTIVTASTTQVQP
jgi:hypothetical protein